MASHHLSCDLLGYDDIQRFMLLWTYLRHLLGTIPCRGRRSQTLVNGRESIQMYRLRKALRKERELERDRRKAQVKGCRWTSARVTLHMHEEWCVAHSMSDALW